MNGVKDIYRSVYNYQTEISPLNAFIDKIFLDFDPTSEDKDIIEDVRRVAGVLSDKELSYSVYFSGRGYHIYIYTKPTIADDLNSAPDAIRNFVYELMEEAGNGGAPVEYDSVVVGDLMRVSRLPNTLNLKTKRYCIPITQAEVFELSTVDIAQIAQKQRKKQNKISGKLLDLTEYDSAVKKHSLTGLMAEFDDDEINFPVNVEQLPLCVQKLLEAGNPGYNERYLIIVAMRDMAYPLGSTINTMEEYLDEEEFKHSVFTERQPQYLYSRPDLIFPTCYTVKQRGCCIQGCKGQNIYY